MKQTPLQKAAMEQFMPRFGHGADVFYVGAGGHKSLIRNDAKLESLKISEFEHGELPDVVAYSDKKNWLFLVDTVHGFGSFTPIRLLELRRVAKDRTAEIVFITAFITREAFRKLAPDIPWETEVWFADEPDHLIHFDGDKFLGPYKSK